MTLDEIIQMAQEAGISARYNEPGSEPQQALQRFAELVATKEREACMQDCESVDKEYESDPVSASWCADAIRERSKKRASKLF